MPKPKLSKNSWLQSGKKLLKKGNYESALQSFHLAYSETKDDDFQFWIAQIEKVRKKYLHIAESINAANRQIDMLEFNMAENTLRTELDKISEGEMQEVALVGIIDSARELLNKAELYHHSLQDQVSIYIDNANAVIFETEDYEGALKLFGSAISLLNNKGINSAYLSDLVNDAHKKKSEQDRVIRHLLARTNAVAKSNSIDIVDVENLISTMQKYEAVSRQIADKRVEMQKKLNFLTSKDLWMQGIVELETKNPYNAFEYFNKSILYNSSDKNKSKEILSDLGNDIASLDEIGVLLKYDRVGEALIMIEPICKKYPLNKYIRDLKIELIEQKHRPRPGNPQKFAAIVFILISLYFLLRILGLL